MTDEKYDDLRDIHPTYVCDVENCEHEVIAHDFEAPHACLIEGCTCEGLECETYD